MTRTIGWVHENAGTSNARSDITVDSWIFAMQNHFWNNRIVTTFGYREDEANNTAFGHVLIPFYGETLTEDTTVSGYREDDPINADTMTAGVVFHVSNNFSLLANYATSIGLARVPEYRLSG